MIITAVAVGTRGDVNPLADLGEELTERGHEFRVLTHEAFRPLIEQKGLRYLKFDTDADHVMQYLVAEYKTGMDFVRGIFKLKKENPGFMTQTLEAINGSDLVIYGTCSAFAYHAAELLGIPCARVFFSPMDATRLYSLYSDGYDSEKVLKSYRGLPEGLNFITMLALNRWRKKNGLPGWRLNSTYTELMGRKVLTFYPTSRVMMEPDPMWHDHIHVTGYWYHPAEAESDYSPPEELKAFLSSGEPDIFVAFGKAESEELARLQTIVLQAVRESGLRAVIQADQIPETDRKNTDQLYFTGPVPYSYIFGKVRAVVHHGGNTTNGLGLRAGRPTLVIGLALDQIFYGRRDHHIGAGPEPVSIRKGLCTVEEIKSALSDLVSGKYDRGAEEAAGIINSEDGVKEAADAIESYIMK
ncbi:MAG: glycosyltransferase [Lachnospiraceae bacterium]|nr:glycosyltransferase [Lachnospiraceae bacterium]